MTLNDPEYPEMTNKQRALYWRFKIGQAVAGGYPPLEEVIWDIMQMERSEGFKAGARHEHETIAKAGEVDK